MASARARTGPRSRAASTRDALFLDDIGVGRCDFPRGDAGALYDSVVKRLFPLPDATVPYVGHDYPPAGRTWKASTTVGEAKLRNVQLSAAMPEPEKNGGRYPEDADRRAVSAEPRGAPAGSQTT